MGVDGDDFKFLEPDEIAAVRDIVNKFELYYLEKYNNKRTNQFKMAQSVVNLFNENLYEQVTRYDIFRELKVDFDENLISDVMASLLNPKKSPMGKGIVINILKHFNKTDVAKIIENTEPDKISCRREVSGDGSRIDIRMTTHNEDYPNAIIDFELKGKNPYACETYINGKPQTVREYDELLKQCDVNSGYYNKNKCEVVAFYITPSGKKPECKSFIEVSYDDIRFIVTNLVANNVVKNPDTLWSMSVIKAFFNSKWLF